MDNKTLAKLTRKSLEEWDKKLGYEVHNNDITNRFADGSVGYRDLNIKFKNKNDVIAEVQFLQPNMLKEKTKVHKWYDIQKLFKEAPVSFPDAVKAHQSIMDVRYNEAFRLDNPR